MKSGLGYQVSGAIDPRGARWRNSLFVLVIWSASSGRWFLALVVLFRVLGLFFTGGEYPLLAASYALVGIQALQQEFCRRDLDLRAVLAACFLKTRFVH